MCQGCSKIENLNCQFTSGHGYEVANNDGERIAVNMAYSSKTSRTRYSNRTVTR